MKNEKTLAHPRIAEDARIAEEAPLAHASLMLVAENAEGHREPVAMVAHPSIAAAQRLAKADLATRQHPYRYFLFARGPEGATLVATFVAADL